MVRPDTNDMGAMAQADLLDGYIRARAAGGAPRPAALDASLARVAEGLAGPDPDAPFVAALGQRLEAAAGVAPAPAAARRRPRPKLRWLAVTAGLAAAAIATTVGAVVGWPSDRVIVAYPDVVASLEDARAEVTFPLVTAPEGFTLEWAGVFCIQFPGLECSPKAAFVRSHFTDQEGNRLVLIQGYFGGMYLQVPEGHRGEMTVNGALAYWADCRDSVCGTAAYPAGASPVPDRVDLPFPSVASLAWRVTTDGDSQRWINLESETLSVEELVAIAGRLRPVGP